MLRRARDHGGALSASGHTPDRPSRAHGRQTAASEPPTLRFRTESPTMTPGAARALLKVLLKAAEARDGTGPRVESGT